MNWLLCLFFTAMLCGAADPSSKNNAFLQGILKRFPQADANKDGVLTLSEAQAFQKAQQERQANRPKIKPTHADIVYGPHQRNRLDLWLAKSGKPTPLLVCIHGGGFAGGDKSSYHRKVELINVMRAAGISMAAINYRLLKAGKNHYPAAMYDGARALQFLRHNAKRFNLDAKRFGAAGGSAGGCMLMWLGFHDDLADPKSDDPVSRQSTRLLALAPNVGQSCVHLPTLLEWFKLKSLVEFPTSRAFFNYPPGKEVVITDELDRTMRDASPIFHLSKDDPPCYMTFGANVTVTASSNPGLWVHHPIMGFKLKEAMDKRGIECHVQYKEGPVVKGYRDQNDFLIKKLTGK